MNSVVKSRRWYDGGSHAFNPVVALCLMAAIVFPWLANFFDQSFYISLTSRIMIYALAATSLNLLLGYGGMISFGHAAFFGLGGYSVAMLMAGGVHSAWLAWPVAVAVAAVAAALIGAISLRTKGVYFIMITLAFAQMLFYLFISMRTYGGDDGLPLLQRNTVGLNIDLADDTAFYYVVLVCLSFSLLFVSRLTKSRFGRIIEGIRENETRMEALGHPVFGYKLACFVIAAAMAGLAGALMVNQTGLASPNQLYWTQSGMLLVMVILGGVGRLYGGVLGAAVLLVLEETLAAYSTHAQLGVGLVLLAVVFLAPAGISGLFKQRSRKECNDSTR